jgi:4-coumarate--CoA ligase
MRRLKPRWCDGSLTSLLAKDMVRGVSIMIAHRISSSHACIIVGLYVERVLLVPPGMTECSPVSHIAHPKRVVPGSVGQLVPNMQAKIIDVSERRSVGGKVTRAAPLFVLDLHPLSLALQSDSNALPRGKAHVGELCVAGPNVMAGYINNPAATAKTVIDGWLHTGDIGYRDENDDFFIVDRLKELIKVKGFQVRRGAMEGGWVGGPFAPPPSLDGIRCSAAAHCPLPSTSSAGCPR